MNKLTQPWFILPILFAYLNMLTLTTLNNYYQIIMQHQIGFTLSLQKELYFITQIIFLAIFITLFTRTLKFDVSYLIMLAPMIRCLSNILFTLFFKFNLTEKVASALFIVTSLMSFLGVYVPLCLVWSKLSKRFVDGFETTGVALCVFGFFNCSSLANSWICQQFLDWYEVKPGYLERLNGFLIVLICLQLALSLLSFLFFCAKEPRASILKKI